MKKYTFVRNIALGLYALLALGVILSPYYLHALESYEYVNGVSVPRNIMWGRFGFSHMPFHLLAFTLIYGAIAAMIVAAYYPKEK